MEKLERPSAEAKEAETDLERVARAVDALPDVYREVVVLRFWEKRGTEEISAILAIPQGTVKSRLSRADAILFDKLRPYWSRENK
jgi:RNA polymerase sigma-70 factor (ECF subfamily)